MKTKDIVLWIVAIVIIVGGAIWLFNVTGPSVVNTNTPKVDNGSVVADTNSGSSVTNDAAAGDAVGSTITSGTESITLPVAGFPPKD